MDKLYLVGLNGGRMRSNVKAERSAIRRDDIESELALWLGKGLPCLSYVIGLLFRCELLERPETTAAASREFAV